MKICKPCNRSYEDDKRYCRRCGGILEAGSVSELSCDNCGTTNRSDVSVCRKCGFAIGQAPRPVAATPTQETLQKQRLAAENNTAPSPTVQAADPVAGPVSESISAPEPAVMIEPPRPGRPKPASLAETATQPKPETTIVGIKAEATAQPNVERQPEAVRQSSRSRRWAVAAGVVVLLVSGIGYLFLSGLIGKNPAKVQMALNAELKAQGLDNLSIAIGQDWVATVGGSADNQTDKGRALGIVQSNKDVKHVEDHIVVVTAQGSSADATPEYPSAQSPSLKKVEELIKQGAFE